jgi:hypothetical protein
MLRSERACKRPAPRSSANPEHRRPDLDRRCPTPALGGDAGTASVRSAAHLLHRRRGPRRAERPRHQRGLRESSSRVPPRACPSPPPRRRSRATPVVQAGTASPLLVPPAPTCPRPGRALPEAVVTKRSRAARPGRTGRHVVPCQERTSCHPPDRPQTPTVGCCQDFGAGPRPRGGWGRRPLPATGAAR